MAADSISLTAASGGSGLTGFRAPPEIGASDHCSWYATLPFWRTGNSDWFTGSDWLPGAGIVMALLAAIAGLIDVLGEPRIRALRAV
jgi:hypothetical protein